MSRMFRFLTAAESHGEAPWPSPTRPGGLALEAMMAIVPAGAFLEKFGATD